MHKWLSFQWKLKIIISEENNTRLNLSLELQLDVYIYGKMESDV